MTSILVNFPWPGVVRRCLWSAAGAVCLTVASAAAVTTVAAAAESSESRAIAASAGHLRHAGRWLVDEEGRVVVLHGGNIVAKSPPRYPSAWGIGDDDAALLQRNGFDAIRLGVMWAALEPRAGVYDDRYLQKLAKTVRTFWRHGMYSLLEFHQDQWNEEYTGAGFPDWALIDDGLANNRQRFPGGYVTNAALQRAEDNFFSNVAGPGGFGLQDRYAKAWAHVVRFFRNMPGVLGYEIMNEPPPGSEYLACVSNAGCADYDKKLARFYRKVIGAIRKLDSIGLIFYEPLITFDISTVRSYLRSLGDTHLVFAYHPYDGKIDVARLRYAQSVADRNNAPAVLTELGQPSVVLAAADAAMQGWLWWSYWSYANQYGCGACAVLNPNKPLTGNNLDRKTLDQYIRPFPRALAGTPQGWSWNQRTNTFTLTYKTAPPKGVRRTYGPTEIFLPQLVYRHGYTVQLTGADLLPSADHGQLLRIKNKQEASRVRVVVHPGNSIPTPSS